MKDIYYVSFSTQNILLDVTYNMFHKINFLCVNYPFTSIRMPFQTLQTNLYYHFNNNKKKSTITVFVDFFLSKNETF